MLMNSEYQSPIQTLITQGRRRVLKSGPAEEAIECRRHEGGGLFPLSLGGFGGGVFPLSLGGVWGPLPRISFEF